ncbi:hypothetical protein MSTO_36560 [Mycobacterium stomatepiae]|uniref:Uncharacterized protein n=1 Tax=Mycobacterium stomatepiae TaxID=470076 RepID=A0A7I7QBD2_9MYCO|nr:hypothetical protein MSTO_36560 [Mycobacterium stomatepiae]
MSFVSAPASMTVIATAAAVQRINATVASGVGAVSAAPRWTAATLADALGVVGRQLAAVVRPDAYPTHPAFVAGTTAMTVAEESWYD